VNGSVYIWLLSVFVALVNILFWSRIKRIERDIRDNKNKNEKLEKNYIARFEELHAKLNEVEKNIIREIFEIKLLALSKQSANDGSAKSEEVS